MRRAIGTGAPAANSSPSISGTSRATSSASSSAATSARESSSIEDDNASSTVKISAVWVSMFRLPSAPRFELAHVAGSLDRLREVVHAECQDDGSEALLLPGPQHPQAHEL